MYATCKIFFSDMFVLASLCYFLFGRLGLKIALADVNESKLETAGKDISAIVGDANVIIVPTDVSKPEEVIRLRDKVYEAWGEVRIWDDQLSLY